MVEPALYFGRLVGEVFEEELIEEVHHGRFFDEADGARGIFGGGLSEEAETAVKNGSRETDEHGAPRGVKHWRSVAPARRRLLRARMDEQGRSHWDEFPISRGFLFTAFGGFGRSERAGRGLGPDDVKTIICGGKRRTQAGGSTFLAADADEEVRLLKIIGDGIGEFLESGLRERQRVWNRRQKLVRLAGSGGDDTSGIIEGE